jgi:hypothetical protein
MAVEGADSSNISIMSDLKDGNYRIRFIDLNNLPPPIGGMFATSSGEGKPIAIAPDLPPISQHQVVCIYQ